MADNVERILDLRINYGDAIKKIAEYREAVSQVDTEEKKLQKQLERGEVTQQEYLERLSALKIERKEYADQIRVLNKEVQNEIRQNGEASDSLVALRAELSNATRAYDLLSKEERESAAGQELQKHIMEVSTEIKNAEYATNRFYRNVGNYPKEIISTIRDTYAATGSLSAGMKAGAESVKTLSTQLMKLMLNPVVAFFAAIAAVVMGVVKVFNDSEERTNRLKQAMSALEPIVNAVKNAFGVLADVITSVIEVVVGLIDWVARAGAEFMNFIGIQNDYNEKVNESIELEKSRQEVIERTRAFMVAEAEAELEVSKLMDKVAQKDKYTREERLAFLEMAIAIEKKISEERIAIARINYQNLVKEAQATENDAEMIKRLAEAKRDLARAETEYYNATKKLQKQRASYVEEEKREEEQRKKAEEDAAKRRSDEAKRQAAAAANARKQAQQQKENDEKEARQKEMKALQDAEDSFTRLIVDEYERRVTETRQRGEREIAALEERLRTEKNLTEKARAAINQTIVNKRIELEEKLAEMENGHIEKLGKAADRELEEVTANDIKVQAKRLQVAIDSAEELSEKRQELEMQQLEADKARELEELENSRMDEEQKNEMKLLIEQDYHRRSLELLDEYEEKRREAKEEAAKKEMEIEQARYEFAANVFGGLSKIADQFAEDNKALAKMSKVLALAEIAINTGKAISAGVANAQQVGFPANIAAIAVTVATVLANMASAIATVKSAKFAKGGTVDAYAGGGSVKGAGSGTSDSISARLSNGESVNTALSTELFGPILSGMNMMAGGNPISGGGQSQIGMEMLAAAFARGAAMVPAPVVSVEEVTAVQRRVSALESMATA